MMLDVVKDSLGFNKEDSRLDAYLETLINGCKTLLRDSGVLETYIENEDPLVVSFIIIYVSSMYGFKSDGSLKELPKHFDALLKQIALTKNK